MLAGAIAVSISLLGLSTSSATTHAVFGNSSQARSLAQATAVLWFVLLNLSIQPLQVASRAYIVENCGAGEQVLANAWASRVQGICGILGFVLASAPLTDLLPFGGRLSQFTLLSGVSGFLLVGMVCIACLSRPVGTTLNDIEVPTANEKGTDYNLFRKLRRMPQAVRSVYLIQWFAWMGWFPFIAYYTS
jgi:solute carrier family 45, member 1/2/4